MAQNPTPRMRRRFAQRPCPSPAELHPHFRHRCRRLKVRLCLGGGSKDAPPFYADAVSAPQTPAGRTGARAQRCRSLLRRSCRRCRRQDLHGAARPYQAPHAGADNTFF